MNRQKNLLSTSGTSQAEARLKYRLSSQRRKSAALARETAALQARGNELLAVSNSLAKQIVRSGGDLASAFHLTKIALASLPLRSSERQPGLRLPSKIVTERILTDAPDMVEALQDAAKILKMEFDDTEGSGKETLAKCESVLKRAQSVLTIELPLY